MSHSTSMAAHLFVKITYYPTRSLIWRREKFISSVFWNVINGTSNINRTNRNRVEIKKWGPLLGDEILDGAMTNNHLNFMPS